MTWTPTHKIMLGCNHRPRVRDTDTAIWRRLKLIPFDVTIPPECRDKQLAEKLAGEAEGILAWAVGGCLDWRRAGLGNAEEVQHATEEYRRSEDQIAAFLAEVCILEEGRTARASDLLKEYREWSGDKHITQRRFDQMLTERGFDRFHSGGTWYRGIGLPPEF